MKIYFLIPVFNEELNIQLLAENIKISIPGFENKYVFVDDCSTDSTVECIQNNFSEEQFHIIKKNENHGPGHSFNLGFEWILKDSSDNDDFIVTMEADNTSDIGILSKMITISKLGYDLVLASVYVQGGGFSKTNWFRMFISFFANMIFRALLNIKVLTLNSFYRVYKISLIRNIDQNYGKIISEPGFICMLEILLKCIRLKADVIEIPMILHSNQRNGKSKMKIMKTMWSYVRFLFYGQKIYKKNIK